ncbi:methyltransferase domain-containing protein [candidate division WOR-3 bacterium]|nr:methyltransferase domain-containing protein [candidate division WOR-3 bacterium]
MKTNYLFHDEIYKKIKEKGGHSWGGEDEFRKAVRILEKEIPKLSEKSKILEIGSGNGVVSFWLAEKGYKTYGIDISPTAIGWAKELSVQRKIITEFKVGSVTELYKHYDENSFDFVVDGYCLHCIIGDDRNKLLSGVYRCLKPSGKFLVQTMCNDPKEESSLAFFDKDTRCVIKDGIAGRYYGSPEKIKEELVNTGFCIVCSRIERLNQDTLFVLCQK